MFERRGECGGRWLTNNNRSLRTKTYTVTHTCTNRTFRDRSDKSVITHSGFFCFCGARACYYYWPLLPLPILFIHSFRVHGMNECPRSLSSFRELVDAEVKSTPPYFVLIYTSVVDCQTRVIWGERERVISAATIVVSFSTFMLFYTSGRDRARAFAGHTAACGT